LPQPISFQIVLLREWQTVAPAKIGPRATGHYRIFRSRF